MYLFMYACTQLFAQLEGIRRSVSMQFAAVQVRNYASFQLCKYANMQVCRYASMHGGRVSDMPESPMEGSNRSVSMLFSSVQLCNYTSM
jgi:hypothetical protein